MCFKHELESLGLTTQLLDGGPLLKFLPGLGQIFIRSPHRIQEQANAVLQRQS